MSDRETGGIPGSDEDLSLPKATVAKMIAGRPLMLSLLFPCSEQSVCSELLPRDVSCAKETRDLVIECCVGEVIHRPRTENLHSHSVPCCSEFIHLISSEANEICEKESKKTIAPEHIISALKVCSVYRSSSVLLTLVLLSISDSSPSLKRCRMC